MRSRKTLTVKWQRLLHEGLTCPRCGTTEGEVEKALAVLTQALRALDFDVILEKGELSVEEFKKDALQSNMIRINGRSLEDWIDGKTGKSQCCDICGLHDCRTIELENEVYENVPSELIVKAGLIAASQLLGPKTSMRKPERNSSENRCCPQ